MKNNLALTLCLLVSLVGVAHADVLGGAYGLVEMLHPATTGLKLNDNVNLTLGTGDDATIDYDGTDLVINPTVVGTGAARISGQGAYPANAVTCATATDDFDINWDAGNIAHLDLEGCDQDANDVNAPTNAKNYSSYVITIEQATAGTRDLTWNAVFLFPGGTDPVNTQSNNARDVVTCLYVDSVYHCSSVLDLQ